MLILTRKLLFTSYICYGCVPVSFLAEAAEHFEMWGAHLPLSLAHTPP